MTQNTKTPAMVLQEFTIKHKLSPPEYNLRHMMNGTNENQFEYQVEVANVTGYGFGRSKQVAKHAAAANALEKLAQLNLFDPQSTQVQQFDAQLHRNETGSPFKSPVNYIGNLKDFCAENKFPQPLFTEISDVGPPHCRQFTVQCSVASITTQAIASTKKQAKQLAAKEMMDKVKEYFPELVQECEANNCLTADDELISRYEALNVDTIANKSIVISDATHTVANLMKEKGLTFSDFQHLLAAPSEANLTLICEKLGVNYKTYYLQEDLPIAAFIMEIETPFTDLAPGASKTDAMENLAKSVCRTLKVYMNIEE